MLTSTTQLQLEWDPLTTEEEIGGVVGEVAISSYHLEWDQGLGDGSWSELIGLTVPFTGATFTTDPSDPALHRAWPRGRRSDDRCGYRSVPSLRGGRRLTTPSAAS